MQMKFVLLTAAATLLIGVASRSVQRQR